MISFNALLLLVRNRSVIVLPREASGELPSRGMVMVRGSLNGAPFVSALEPDGRGSHWLSVDDSLLRAANVVTGDEVKLEIESVKEWPEPTIPEDLQKALDHDDTAYALWRDITPMARWDWIRWIRSTNNPATRAKHIEVTFSKLRNGDRRPCCFNRSMCTDMSVSQRGVLLEPSST